MGLCWYADSGFHPPASAGVLIRPWPYQTSDDLLVWPSTGQSRNDSDHLVYGSMISVSSNTPFANILILPSLYGYSVPFHLILLILFWPCLLFIISGTSTGARWISGTLQNSASGREVPVRCYSLVARGLSTSFYHLHRILSFLSSCIFINRHTLPPVHFVRVFHIPIPISSPEMYSLFLWFWL